jgi:hypothetical protein
MQKIIFLPVIGLLATAAILLQSQSGDHVSKELKYDAMMELLYRRQATDSSLAGFLPAEYKSNSAFKNYSPDDLVRTIKRRPGGKRYIGSLDVKSFSQISSPPMRANALGTCAFFQKTNRSVRQLSNGDIQLCFVPYEKVPLCADEPFAEEHIIANGTAFAINDSVICTTSHYRTDWSNLLFIFDYTAFNISTSCKIVAATNVFRTKRILREDKDVDFVLFVVDRRIPKKWQVRKIDFQYSYRKFNPVYMTGHPLGLPLKLSYNAMIYESRRSAILTDLDAFDLNSGSPVFCATSHSLIGMLTGGSGASSNIETDSSGELCRKYYSSPYYTSVVASKFIPITFLLNTSQ